MKAALLTAYGAPLTIEDVQLDAPGPGEIVVRTVASGVCHTDRTIRTGAHGTPTPIVLGHEAAGVVIDVGPDVAEFAVGDHVVACSSGFCGSCEWCLRGLSHLCVAKGRDRAPGSRPRLTWNGEGVPAHSGIGGYAEELLIPQRSAVRVPKEMPLDRAALLGCAVITGVGSVLRMAKVRPGQTVVVIGIGGVGLNVVQAARLSGASRIIAVDRVAEKLRRARAFGATDVLDASAVDTVEVIRELTSGGVDHAFEVVGRAETIEQAFAVLRPRGTATIVGVPHPDTRISIPPIALFGERRLQGANMGASAFRLDIPMLADLYLQGRLELDALVSDRLALADVDAALDRIEDSTGARAVITFDTSA